MLVEFTLGPRSLAAEQGESRFVGPSQGLANNRMQALARCPHQDGLQSFGLASGFLWDPE